MNLCDHKDRNRCCGFSLVEVMVVLVLMLATLAALMRWQTVQRREASLARERITATLLAANKLEALRGGVVSGAIVAPLVGEDDNDALAESLSVTEGKPGYRRTWRATGLGTDRSLVAIEARVTWHDELGRHHEIWLSTMALDLEATRNEPNLAGRIPLQAPGYE